MTMPERSITITIDGDRPTPDDLRLYAGLLVNAEQLAKDRGGWFEGRLSELSSHNLLHLRSRLVDEFGDAEKLDDWLRDTAPEDATIEGVIWHLLQLIEHEIGGRWVQPH